MDNNFASNLKHLRIERGMTQEELAKRLGKDYSTIGKWELGQRSPIMADVVKISEIFNVSLESLISSNIPLQQPFDELEILFSKHKDILTDDDKEYIKFIIEKRKKEIDKQLGEDNDI